MPAILRIFPYQTDASLAVIGPTTPYDQGAGRLGATPATRCREHLEVDPVQPVDGDDRCDRHNEVEPYVVSGLQYENVPIA